MFGLLLNLWIISILIWYGMSSSPFGITCWVWSLIVKLYCFSTELVVWFRESLKGINEHCFLLRNSVFLQSNDDTAFIGNLSLLFLAFYYLFNFVLPSIFQHQVIHKENNMPVLEMILMSTTGGISEEVCFLSKDAISN